MEGDDMKRLDEETFTVVRVSRAGAHAIVSEDGTALVRTGEHDGERIAQSLALAAPLARALKRLLLAFPTALASEEEAAAVAEARTVLKWAGVPLETETSAEAAAPGEHHWTESSERGVEVCCRPGCYLRRRPNGGMWQRKKYAPWRSTTREPIPPCACK
jgi:hypothetical protein